MKVKYLIPSIIVFFIGGCGTVEPRLIGSVVPLADSQFQSVAESKSKTDAMEVMDHDARLTCSKTNVSDRYVVVSQDSNLLGQNSSGGPAWAGAVARIARAANGTQEQDNSRYEVTTVFKCAS